MLGQTRAVALRYVDHEKPLRDLGTLGYRLPDFQFLEWREGATVPGWSRGGVRRD